MDEELERRLIELEMRVAYQDDELLKMKETVLAHQTQMYHIETRFETLISRFLTLQEDKDNADIPNEKPPHY
ncbi:MAG: SlyX family protein [Candidatus Sericytochromatia bacterium]